MRRDEILEVSLRLFGQHGYRSTSVADIQRAAGMTGGSGALYKHFSSKEELLSEVVHRYVDQIGAAGVELASSLPTDPEPALHMIAHAVLDAMARDRDILRIGFRDLDEFTEIREELWQALLDTLYREMSGWLRRLNEMGTIEVQAPDATASVLVASITYFRVVESMFGHTPGDVSADDYCDAWVRSALATIGLPR